MLQNGDLIDIWVVEKPLGAGGMGSVYRCHNRSALRILAAIKVLEGNLRKYPEAEARFIREAEILFGLDHPNIVKVRNIRTDVDPPYLEMEFVEGRSLEDKLARGALPVDEAVSIMRQLTDAISHLHAKGIRHRDIKPANVVVRDDGTVKLVDFGLAMESDVTRITQQGISFGTVSYAPPEWINPDKLDPALWDLYAAGVVFYEMLTGKVAFGVSGQGNARQQALQVMMAKQGHTPLDPGDAAPTAYREIVKGLTDPDPAARTQTADEVLRALDRASKDTSWLSPLPVTREVDRPEAWATASAMPTVTLDTPRTPSMPSSSALIWAVGALAILAAFGSVSMAGWYLAGLTGTATRDLRVKVVGVPADLHASIAVGDTAARPDGDGFAILNVPTGARTIDWALGKDCGEACPGVGCATWCSSGSLQIAVELGVGAQEVRLSLVPPSPRPVQISVTGGPTDAQIHVQLAGQTATAEAGIAALAAVAPGQYALRVTAGDCPAECSGACPPGCVESRLDLTVPVGSGVVQRIVALPVGLAAATPAPNAPSAAPTTPSAMPAPRPSRPGPTAPAPVPAGALTVGPLVTTSQFAAFLVKRPEYQRQAMLEKKRADEAYLEEWDGATPPPNATPFMSSVSWRAASDYCRDRGGRLPGLTDGPTSWAAVGDAPMAELRQTDADGPAALRFDGITLSASTRNIVPDAGFRCAKK